jgi:hypothetical protein
MYKGAPSTGAARVMYRFTLELSTVKEEIRALQRSPCNDTAQLSLRLISWK